MSKSNRFIDNSESENIDRFVKMIEEADKDGKVVYIDLNGAGRIYFEPTEENLKVYGEGEVQEYESAEDWVAEHSDFFDPENCDGSDELFFCSKEEMEEDLEEQEEL